MLVRVRKVGLLSPPSIEAKLERYEPQQLTDDGSLFLYQVPNRSIGKRN